MEHTSSDNVTTGNSSVLPNTVWTLPNTGWICPKCGRCYAPSVSECGACAPVYWPPYTTWIPWVPNPFPYGTITVYGTPYGTPDPNANICVTPSPCPETIQSGGYKG